MSCDKDKLERIDKKISAMITGYKQAMNNCLFPYEGARDDAVMNMRAYNAEKFAWGVAEMVRAICTKQPGIVYHSALNTASIRDSNEAIVKLCTRLGNPPLYESGDYIHFSNGFVLIVRGYNEGKNSQKTVHTSD